MGSLAVLTMDVELAQHMQAAPKKYSVSRMLVALAAAVAASAATAYAVQHKNRLGDGPASLQRRLWNLTIREELPDQRRLTIVEELPDLIVPPEELGDSIHEDSWTCVPQEESECTGSCRTEDALTTDEDVPGYSLALGYYDGENFVAA